MQIPPGNRARIVGKDGQIPSFSGFLAEIVVQIPELFREEGAFIARSLSQLHIGGKLAVLQKLADTLSGTLPGNDLGGLIVTGSFAVERWIPSSAYHAVMLPIPLPPWYRVFRVSAISVVDFCSSKAATMRSLWR